MPGQIAILEGYRSPRRRRKSGGRRRGCKQGRAGAWCRRFAKAARSCKRRRSGSFNACVSKKLGGSGRSGRRRKRRSYRV